MLGPMRITLSLRLGVEGLRPKNLATGFKSGSP